MRIGIFSNVIGGRTPAEVARATRAHGIEAVQFIPSDATIGFGFDASHASDGDDWAAAYADEEIEVAAVGGYINILHADPDVRKTNHARFRRYIDLAADWAGGYISTETGSYALTSDWHRDPRNRTPEAREDLRRVTDALLAYAEQRGVTLLYEPYIVNVLHTPEMAVEFVREYDSPHLALLMDPTNWFEPDMLDDVAGVIRAGFAVERGLYRLAHAKDVRSGADGATEPELPGPGQGVLDYELYVELLAADGYDGPLFIEHLVEAEVPDAVRYVTRALERAGARR